MTLRLKSEAIDLADCRFAGFPNEKPTYRYLSVVDERIGDYALVEIVHETERILAAAMLEQNNTHSILFLESLT